MPQFLVPKDELPYDPADRGSVLAWAKTLVGKTLAQVADETGVEISGMRRGDKGGFGKLLEIVAFRYAPNSDSRPDLPDARVEIKGLPLLPSDDRRKDPNGWKPKERLELGNINYVELARQTWETWPVKDKCGLMLVVTDEYGSKDVSAADKVIHDVFYLPFPLEHDVPQIKKDWSYVHASVLEGRAHELTSKMTRILDIAPHGQGRGRDDTPQPFSDTLAKRRGWQLKRRYMREIYAVGAENMQDVPRLPGEEELTIEDIVASRCAPYVGMLRSDIITALELGVGETSKSVNEYVANGMLGLSRRARNDEFGRLGYMLRNPNFESTGTLTESISFPFIRVEDILGETWETSLFREQLNQTFACVIWQKVMSKYMWKKQGGAGAVPAHLRGALFVDIPESVIESEGRAVWEATKEAIASSNMSMLPKTGFSKKFSTRPHANNGQPPMVLPNGTTANKQCFWIDSDYLCQLLMEAGLDDLLKGMS